MKAHALALALGLLPGGAIAAAISPYLCVEATKAAKFVSAEPAAQVPIVAEIPTSGGGIVSFFVRDVDGRAMRDVEVELTLASPVAQLWLDELTPSANPQRVVVRTNAVTCEAFAYVAGGDIPTPFTISARVVSTPAIVDTLAVTQAEAAFVGVQGEVRGRAIARPGTPHATPRLVARSTRGRQGNVEVRFVAPIVGASARFANGATEIVARTNPFGVAAVPMVANDVVGSFNVRAFVDAQAPVEIGPFANVDKASFSPAYPLASTEFTYGTVNARFFADLAYPGIACPAERQLPANSPRVSVTYRIDGAAYAPDYASFTTACGPVTASVMKDLGSLPFGTHDVRIEYSGDGFFDPAALGPLRVTVRPAFEGNTPGGRIRMGVAHSGFAEDAEGACTSRDARVEAVGAPFMPASGPPGVDLPYGLVAYTLAPCFSAPAGFPGPGSRRLLLEFEYPIPEGAAVWSYGPSAGDSQPRWRRLTTSIEGRRALLLVTDNGEGDTEPAALRIGGIVALGVPRAATAPANYQDLWWAGPAESGWGVTMSQHRDVIFAAFFVYDAQGRPRWVVMPGGQWNASYTTYTGNLFRPRGSPPPAYNVASFDAGAPVGTATIEFRARDEALLTYTIDGVSGTKSIRRQGFGVPDENPLWRYDDLWWGGPQQNGWGIAIAQQHRSIFAVWFGYDEDGETTWFVLPDGRFGTDAEFHGALYATRGARWLGAEFDASAVKATAVADVRMLFRDRDRLQLDLWPRDGSRASRLELTRQPF